MNTPVTAGFGDPETWGPCTGHPNDPRYDIALDEAIENEKYALLGTPEFDDRNPANIGLAVADIVSHPRLASIMNLSGERKDLLGAIAAADFQAMGDAIRCISRDYWDYRAGHRAVENILNPRRSRTGSGPGENR